MTVTTFEATVPSGVAELLFLHVVINFHPADILVG